MFKNYLKTAFRSLWKSKFYTSINIIGLAAGLAVGIMILLWVQDELSYDKFHKNAPHIYTVVSNLGSGEELQSFDYVPAPVAPFSLREIPEVSNAVRVSPNFDFSLFKYGEKEFTENRTAYIDHSFFTIFDFKLVSGNSKQPFPNNNSVILTRTTAKKYFGKENPIGKVIQADRRMNFTVSGVMEDFPSNSSLQFDMLFPFGILIANFQPNTAWKSLETDWGNYNHQTFLLVQPNAKLENISKKLTELQRKHNPFDKSSFYTVQAFTSRHLYGPDGNSSAMQTVRIFMMVAIFILLIASINYINLSTARAMVRSKEVSVRKIVGAARMQLFFQFVFETVVVFIISSLLAVMLINFLMPLYNQLAGKTIQFSFLSTKVWIIIAITIISALALSSVYPALMLSAFKPIQALKGKVSFGVSNTSFRKILVTTQFVFSAGLIMGTLIISRQLNYVREKELGYEKENVFTFPMRDMQPHYEAIKAELLKQPGVLAVSSASDNIINMQSNTGDTDWDGKVPNSMFLVRPFGVDKDFLSFFKLKLAEGKAFAGTKADSTHFILNETAVREAGIKDPIGKRFKLWQTEGTIIGVVKDFHFSSLRQRIAPSIFYYAPTNWRMYVKTTGRDAAKAIKAAEKSWVRYNAGFPFEYNFLDDTYDQLYKADIRTAILFRVFALIAIVISCLGLLGLATFTTHLKVKEIGIRKVLGASVPGIVNLVSRDFIRLVMLALLIAAPVAWYFMNKWLQDFAYRISIGWDVFILAGFIAVFIAFATISFQAVKAALANPVKSLRTE